jgi:lipopolysaccharide exporter
MKREMARGAVWMVLFRLLDRSIGLISTAVLARLLVPGDFGLVAMSMSVIAFIEMATAFSFDIALIQKKDPVREHFDTAWTLNVIVASLGAAATAAAALPAADFYGDARLAPVMLVIGVAWMVSGFENIGVVNFRREMNFSAEFRLLAFKRVITFAVTMVAAITMRSYWALVAGVAAGRVAGVLLSYAMQAYRPRLSLARASELFSFSGWLLISNFSMVLISRVPHLIVGRTYGAQALGAYSVGAEIANLPHTELVAPINRAMFPGYSRLTQDRDLFRKTCVDTTSAIFQLVLPICIGVALLAPHLVRILLGQQWDEAIPVIQILSLAGAVSALTANNMSAYQALGRPGLCTLTLVARMLLLMVGLVSFRASGLQGVAWAEVLAALGSLIVSVPILARVLQLQPSRYLGLLARPLLAGCVMGLVVHYVVPTRGLEMTFVEALAWLAAGASIGAITYVIAIAVLWWIAGRPDSVEIMLFNKVREIFPIGRRV